MVKDVYKKRLKMFVAVSLLLVSLTTSVVQAGKLLDEIQVPDTCGTSYADKLASCTAFRCTKPSPLAMMSGFPSEAELKKMPAEKQQEIREYMVAAEKKIAAMSPEKMAALKKRMVSTLVIKGYDVQGRCQTTSIAIPGQQLDCALDKTMLEKFVVYARQPVNTKNTQVKSESRLVNGKMVTTQMDMKSSKVISNPWQQALDNGQCKLVDSRPAAQAMPAPSQNIGESANTLFILDASGSMWGQINGQAKISIAKEVMAKLVPELADSHRIALIAYGHRRKGDCNDVETLVPLGKNNKAAVLKAVQGLSAKGKTPLTRSLNQALKILQREKQSATIVLVSDGIESCDADPCEAVRLAKKSGVEFILHTVGFGLSKKDSTQLECMAKAGDGEYFQANNADELLKSTRKALQPMGGIKVTAKVNGKVTNVMLRIVDVATGKVVHENVLPSPSGMTTRLLPGKYNVTVKPAGVNGVTGRVLSNVEITSANILNKTLSFDKGRLELSITRKGKPVHALIHIEDHVSHKWVYESSVFGVDTPITVDLPEGSYDIVFQADAPEKRVENIMVTAGKTVVKNISADVKPVNIGTNKNTAYQLNTDLLGGGDFAHIIPASDNAKLCQQACMQKKQCRSWTYVKPNTIQGALPNCWLKQGVPAAVSNSCCISGVK